MAPRLRSSSAPPSPGLLGPAPSFDTPFSFNPPLATQPPPKSHPHSSQNPLASSPPISRHVGDFSNPNSSGRANGSFQAKNQSSSCPSTPKGKSPSLDSNSRKVTEHTSSLPKVARQGNEIPRSSTLAPKNWSEHLFPASRKMQRLDSPEIQVSGIPLVTIPVESLEEASKEWQDYLIGQFYGLPPSMGRVIGAVNGLWARQGPRVRVHDAGNGTFLFRIPSAEVRNKILARRIWYIGPCPMFVSLWNPYHNPDKPPLRSIATWVTLHNVPHILYNSDCLSRIVTSLGEPLYMDRATASKENLTVARIYTEIQLHRPPPKHIAVRLPDNKELSIAVAYDWLPPTCSLCHEIGHNHHHCPAHPPPTLKQQVPSSPDPRATELPENCLSLPQQVAEELQSVVNEVKSIASTNLQGPSAELHQRPMTQSSTCPNEEVATLAPSQASSGKLLVIQPSAPTTKTDQHMSPANPGKPQSNPCTSKVLGSKQKEVQANSGSKQKGKSRGRKAVRGGLLETHILEENAYRIRAAIPPGWRHQCNYRHGQHGRIWIVWDPSIIVTIYQSSLQAITCGVQQLCTGLSFTATFVYASNQATFRHDPWSELVCLASYNPLNQSSWLVFGDFNQALYLEDRSDLTNVPSQRQGRQDFAACVEEIGLQDVPSSGPHFTWCNNQSANPLSVKLDRAMCNDRWSETFPSVYAEYLSQGPSDHAPCVLRFPSAAAQTIKLKEVQNLTQRVKIAGDKLRLVQETVLQSPGAEAIEREKMLRKEWLILTLAEEKLFRQKSRIKWLQLGDKNTGYFHKVTNARNARNHIHSLVDEDGQKLESVDSIKTHAVNFYADLIGKADEGIRPPSVDTLRALLRYSCPSDIAVELTRIPTPGEIEQVLFAMPENKALGPDGFPKEFFTATWEITGSDLINSVMDFFVSGRLLGQVNATIISLIPKKAGATSLTDYRPISCCNTVYKIISTILAKRLKHILQAIISPNQTAFLQGRLMLENILLATDLIRDYNCKG
ncbi:PREDICTED: uncharacterized protein LOC104810236 [Tarenaya hassleriana]|uniref:uncharacterized protein LOC104810236 n=1 Tax=Tarenaya hassleriana TaxID=28532 RepID=UPI00053C255D|nr:PREDICTED: uncharacterized protein LOC104810236 [Tarenaya hassleriana]